MEARRSNEAVAIRVDNAIAAVKNTLPSAATDGIAVRRNERERTRCHLRLEMAAAGGTRSVRVKVYGRQTRAFTQAAADEKLTEIAADKWFEIFDTGVLSDAADFNLSFMLQGAQDYDRLYTTVPTLGGTTPTLTTYIGFAGVE